jgi:hypothetical protein
VEQHKHKEVTMRSAPCAAFGQSKKEVIKTGLFVVVANDTK